MLSKDNEETKRNNEHLHMFDQMKKAKEDASKKKELVHPESESDSEVEESKKSKNKRHRKRVTNEIKNMRRTKEREPIYSIQDQAITIPMEEIEEALHVPEDKIITDSIKANTIKKPYVDDDEDSDEDDGLLRVHSSLSYDDMKKLSAKKLQTEDASNPLPLQRLFYEKKKNRPSSKRQKTSHQTTLDDDQEYNEFEKCLHGIDYSDQDMSMVIDMLKKSVKSWHPSNKTEWMESLIKHLDVVSRETDDSMLRTPRSYERRCLNDGNCEGTKIPGCKPVILVENLSIVEKEKFMRGGYNQNDLPSTRRLCLLCARYVVMYYYINIRAECSTIRTKATLTKFGNIVDKKGEYDIRQCIMTGSTDYPGVPLPVVAHCRFHYKQKYDVANNVTYFEQIGYKKPEDHVIESAKELVFH
jgi:hypothetical protein